MPGTFSVTSNTILWLLITSAAYGFSIGASHSWTYASRNLVKFPLLIGTTALVCALAYYIVARVLAPRLSFRDVQGLVVRLFRDTSIMLASLAPVTLFLALTMEQPTSTTELGEYPFFQGINIVLIAVCGSIALLRQAHALLRTFSLTRNAMVAILLAWLALTLLTGAQGAWYLRPFFGVAAPGRDLGPFFLGTTPDFRGATSFFEAVYNLVVPPGGP